MPAGVEQVEQGWTLLGPDAEKEQGRFRRKAALAQVGDAERVEQGKLALPCEIAPQFENLAGLRRGAGRQGQGVGGQPRAGKGGEVGRERQGFARCLVQRGAAFLPMGDQCLGPAGIG